MHILSHLELRSHKKYLYPFICYINYGLVVVEWVEIILCIGGPATGKIFDYFVSMSWREEYWKRTENGGKCVSDYGSKETESGWCTKLEFHCIHEKFDFEICLEDEFTEKIFKRMVRLMVAQEKFVKFISTSDALLLVIEWAKKTVLLKIAIIELAVLYVSGLIVKGCFNERVSKTLPQRAKVSFEIIIYNYSSLYDEIANPLPISSQNASIL